MPSIYLEHQAGRCGIEVGEKLIADGAVLEACKDQANHFVVITDSHVADLVADGIVKQLQDGGQACTRIVFPAGESSKTRDNKQQIEDQMLEAGCGRDTAIIAVGGGVVTDLAGFVAATYCRGIASFYVPTTLLAMVDAGVGGKTGVNTAHGKNLIGAFYQPRRVFCDVSTLHSLSRDQVADGLVETIKHALIVDRNFFFNLDAMLDQWNNQQALSDEAMVELVHRSCGIKCDMVALDECERQGPRQLLNFGHTIAHAIERQQQYRVSHGQAVLVGLWVASCLSCLLKILPEDDFNQIKKTLAKIQFDQKLPLSTDDIAELQQHMVLDKKSINKQARFVLLDAIGEAHVEEGQYSFPVDDDLVAEALGMWMDGVLAG